MRIPQELKNYIHNQKKIDILLEKLEILKTRATKVNNNLSDMPRSNNNSNDKLGDIVAEIVDNMAKIGDKIKEIEEEENKILNKIQKIAQPFQNALYVKYINNKTIAETSVELNYSYQQTIRILKKANKLYEEENN